MIDLESSDAGAFFRFTDVYSRMTGGQMALAMESPSADNPVQQGVLRVHNFAVHDEAQLERAVSNGAQRQRNGIEFSGMRVEFNRMPGRVALREGVVRGPVLGGTIDGSVDYTRDEVHLRGTLVPLYGPNNLLGQIPMVGLFLGGEKEGLVGITYEVVGRPGNPVLRINPISALAPGLLRKVFEFPATNDNATPTTSATPVRRSATSAPPLTLSQTGLSRTCRLRPSESLITPSASGRSGDREHMSSSVSTLSLTLRPPPRISRRASPFEETSPARTAASA